ncbi:RNA polymerase sigma factor sigE, chloroplastic/mitochondrial [Rutidosis leptorrhynchoides]|uniref:RNA polymerase sigma factor sigE, chloroplastic/mitochondrial n=1 Tax=Rutidosis leptorrhynchoides TaxID=125765 RepID=UPI003A99BF03
MGVVTVSSSVARTPFRLSARFSDLPLPTKRATIVAFKTTDKTKNTALVSSKESSSNLSVDTSKKSPKRLRRSRTKKPLERVQALSTDEAPSCSLDLDYMEAAAELNRLYKLSPPAIDSDSEYHDTRVKKVSRVRKKVSDASDKSGSRKTVDIVRSQHKRLRRLTLENRIHLKNNKDVAVIAPNQKRKHVKVSEDVKANRLMKDNSASADLASLDWKKMKIPPVLSSSEHSRLFKLLQTMKAILAVKEDLQKVLEREPTDGELAEATNMNVPQLRKQLGLGQSARNKLIKHNLRLVLFVMNKYFQEFANGRNFQDFCQAGVKGLITAIDRFEPRRKLQLSTYALFWIRHAIIRSMTLSSFFKVPFGLESVRIEIQKAKKKLWFDLMRPPTEEEISKKAGISLVRYREVIKASRPILSLNRKNPVTQEEFINTFADDDDYGSDNERRPPALLRLALDDVLDSLKPKESLVIRQRYGLDGKGNRTLGEIAGNLSISREMVRKHEVKALMKLKHPARVEYLRHYLL